MPSLHVSKGQEGTISVATGYVLSVVFFYMQSLFFAFQSLMSIYTGLAEAIGAANKVSEYTFMYVCMSRFF